MAECDHDFEFIGEGYYEGSRPGWSYDEFFCRRCLKRVAVKHGTDQQVENPDPTWFKRRRK